MTSRLLIIVGEGGGWTLQDLDHALRTLRDSATDELRMGACERAARAIYQQNGGRRPIDGDSAGLRRVRELVVDGRLAPWQAVMWVARREPAGTNLDSVAHRLWRKLSPDLKKFTDKSDFVSDPPCD